MQDVLVVKSFNTLGNAVDDVLAKLLGVAPSLFLDYVSQIASIHVLENHPQFVLEVVCVYAPHDVVTLNYSVYCDLFEKILSGLISGWGNFLQSVVHSILFLLNFVNFKKVTFADNRNRMLIIVSWIFIFEL